MDIENYILPIMGNTLCGCGFFAGNHFITAGHVVVKCNLPLVVWFEGKKYTLNFNNLLQICYSKEIEGRISCADFAVFTFDNINSPLDLADYTPTNGQVLRCITYDEVHAKTNNNVPAIFANEERIVKINTDAIVRIERQENFFACDTKSILHEGNSGSPLIDSDNKIVGILHGGTKIPECCVFQSASSIKQFIKY